MEQVLTLVAAPGGLEERALTQVRAALEELGGDTLSPRWLAKGRAADLPYALLSSCQADSAARQALAGRPIDLFAQDAAQRRKMLLIADMDSTMLTGETLDELAEFAGLRPEIAAITQRSVNGELDFETALRQRVALLQGLDAAALEHSYGRMRYTAGARTLVATMKAHGAFAVVVSGGFRFFTGRVRAHCGFDRDLANELEIRDGRLTGQVVPPVLDRARKLQALLGVAAERQVPLSLCLAVGDGANDLDMIGAAGLGVAFHAGPAIAGQARARIDHGDLTTLLFAQGYAEDEFVA